MVLFPNVYGMTEDEMVGWHQLLNGQESGWTPGVGDGQGGLECWGPWGQKESDTAEWLNLTELNAYVIRCGHFGRQLDWELAISVFGLNLILFLHLSFQKLKKKKNQKNKKLLDLEIYYIINILVENINFSDFWFWWWKEMWVQQGCWFFGL